MDEEWAEMGRHGGRPLQTTGLIGDREKGLSVQAAVGEV